MEDIVLDVLGLPDVVAHPVAVKRMPGDSNVQVIEYALPVHDNLPGHNFFRRTSIYADSPGRVTGLHIFL